ncbi:Tat pathway signal sequence domain protein [Wenjunlia vitaminophila]|uniref:Tat pathway signal sequence domain protein n=1 Tax=Wenjunlia vitaminophila TaxID=76728 RepID=A0A0T6LQW1_WENVI|nr:DUF4429 domain-containing protein [Wenjunlia vitaminophila]KRV48515.1 Tat pathway signal sequence domain protein [Wenjunlia vitaminophila]
MAEVLAKDGTWTFDGDAVRVVPGRGRGVHKLRQELGQVTVPLMALAGVGYEPVGRRGGRLRLRVRAGADPFTQVVGGKLSDDADPYQLVVDADHVAVAEYFAEEVRTALLLEQVPEGPCDDYLVSGPQVPLTAAGVDGSLAFDGASVRVEWNWMAEESKRSVGGRTFVLADLVTVEWRPASGLDFGHLRFRGVNDTVELPAEHDPNCVLLWGTKKESSRTALLAAAVTARLPHPSRPAPARHRLPRPTEQVPAPVFGEDQDVLLRRLRELGELHRDGVLTDEEFTAAKRAVLRRMG